MGFLRSTGEFISDMAGTWGEILTLPVKGEDMLERTLGLLGWVATGLVAGTIGLVGYNIHLSGQDADQLTRMDASPTLVFKDVAHCQSQGKEATFCVDAFRTATEKHQRKGYYYGSMEKCASYHAQENCTAIPYSNTTYTLVGKVMVPIHHSGTRYHPAQGGFQVSADNPALAIPVFKTAQPGVMLRADMKFVGLSM